jgi:hypothetical protein
MRQYVSSLPTSSVGRLDSLSIISAVDEIQLHSDNLLSFRAFPIDLFGLGDCELESGSGVELMDVWEKDEEEESVDESFEEILREFTVLA